MLSSKFIKFSNLNLKKNLKLIYGFFVLAYKIFLFIPSLFFLAALKFVNNSFLKDYSKIISLRITPKYFGHLSIEPAILSSFCSREKTILPIVSFKKGEGIKNTKLETIAKNSFNIKPDFLNKISEHIFNYSFENIRSKISNFYTPLLKKNSKTREMHYVHLLDTEKVFEWRENAKKIIFRKEDNKFKLIIALRTNHFSKNVKNVASQPWRDASANDIIYITKVFSKIIDPKDIYLFSHPDNLDLINNKELKELNINFVDQSKIDILSIISSNSILVNNGNGIGAAAMAIGIKTLYIHHTLWHFWHTSHSNAVCLPSKFISLKFKQENNLEKIVSLAFSPKCVVPFDFSKYYYPKGIINNNIQDIDEEILIKTLKQILSNKKNRFKEEFMGCSFEYENKEEKEFWKIFIEKLPQELRESHKLIKLNISTSFLKSF